MIGDSCVVVIGPWSNSATVKILPPGLAIVLAKCSHATSSPMPAVNISSLPHGLDLDEVVFRDRRGGAMTEMTQCPARVYLIAAAHTFI